MFERRSLKLPIALGITMIVLVVVLIVGLVLLSVLAAMREGEHAGLYWTLLSVGTVLLTAVLVGVVLYLTLSVKAFNLNRRQSNFVDSVTHELKSPIASLKLCLQTLTRRHVGQEERESFHRFMLEDVDRLNHLINHLLDAGRVDRPSFPGDEEDVELAELLATCTGSVCLRHGVDRSMALLELEPCIVHARQLDLDMIFRNLIDNAVKYAGKPPQVEVTVRRTDRDTVTVWVRDNGRGIPANQRRRVFSRFVRLGLELERDQPGTGLGLYIVRTLVRRLRGSVRVRDPERGPGTVFEVRLPARIAADSLQPKVPPRDKQTEAEVA